jgi:hypothetical protein
VRNRDVGLTRQLKGGLREFSREVCALPGVSHIDNLNVLVAQIIDSIRRVEYVHRINLRDISPDRANAASDIFDPLRAALLHRRQGNIDEAFWLIFLSTHFGKHSSSGWRLTRDVYGSLGGRPWTWRRIAADTVPFRLWLADNQARILRGPQSGKFGNHRKYESLRPTPNGTGAVIDGYVNWIRLYGGHDGVISNARQAAGDDAKDLFSFLYRNMRVHRFGRTAKFDYLTMLGKTGLAPIEPGSAYLNGATGPLKGARLLFEEVGGIRHSKSELDSHLIRLGGHLNIGMQVVEDSLCNWQKSPSIFVRFRG